MVIRAALLSAAFVMVSGVAHAQNNIYVFEEETIVGRIEKPEAFYILSPSNLEYRWMDAEASFLERIYETVQSAPL